MSEASSPASSLASSPTSSPASSPTSSAAPPTPLAAPKQKTKKQLEKENKKLLRKLQTIKDEEFVQKLTKEGDTKKFFKIWKESTLKQKRLVLDNSILNEELLRRIRTDNTDLSEFIDTLDKLNTNMRNEINDVFIEIKGISSNPEKLKQAWKKHKPFIVRNRGEVLGDDGDLEIKKRKCALNFGAHRCVYHFLPFDKKKIFEPKVVIEPAVKSEEVEEVTANEAANSAAEIPVESPQVQSKPSKTNTDNTKKEKKNKDSITKELKRCKQYTKVVGIDLDFYRKVDTESLVAKTIEAAIESENIISTTGRQYFCDKHLKQLVGLVPKQVDGDSLAYHLIATQPFYKGDYVATFSQIKVSTDINVQAGLRISPVSYFTSNIEDNKIGTLDDTCFKDLGDYITDPNADNVFDFYIKKKDQQITEEKWENSFLCLEGKCNVEIELKKVKKKNKICLKATRTICKNDIIYLNFGIDYWKQYLKFNAKKKNFEPAVKSDLRYYKNIASYNSLKSRVDEIKNKYVDLLLMDTIDPTFFPKKEENTGNVDVDSVPKKKLSLNRLNNLYKHHFRFNKQTK